MRFAILLALVACGGGSASVPQAEIPPIDEEPEEHVVRDDPPQTVVEREDLGVISLVELPSDSPVVTLRAVFDVGSAEDPEGMEGITNLTAELMVEGGAGELSFRQLTERLYPIAGSITALTGRDQTVIIGRVHRDHLNSFYELYRDVLLRPRLADSDFGRLKNRALSALTLSLRGNNDEELGKEVLQAMLYEGHPYGHPTLGTEQGLQAITHADVRRHAEQVFCAGRAIVGVAGQVPEGFASQMREDLASRRSEACVGRRVLESPSRRGAPRMWLVDKPEAASVAISAGMPISVTRDHPDYPALTLAAAYMGQHRTFAGRLMRKMRGERGLNYGDYAYAEHFDQEPGTRFPLANRSRRQQYFSVWIRPVRRDQAHFALRMMVREVRAFAQEGLSEEDFERIRDFATRYYALYQQTESRRLGFLIDDRFYDTVDPWLETLTSKWAELTREQVNAAIARHIHPEQLQIAVVTAEAESFASKLVSEEASPIRYRGRVPEHVTEEDPEIINYRIGIGRDQMRIVPVAETFAR